MSTNPRGRPLNAPVEYTIDLPVSLSLDELARDPARARDLPPKVARDLLARLVPLQALLLAQALQPSADGQPEVKGSCGDRLLTVKQAAEKLGCSTDYLYRNKNRLPFTVRQGRRVMFSERGIERDIHQRMGAMRGAGL